MATRTVVYPRIARELGGHAGSISSGTATTAVLAGLIGNYPDDEFIDQLLLMPEAATAADRERQLTDWTQVTGTATWVGNRSDTSYSNETYFLLPKPWYTLTEIQDAVDETLRQTYRSVRTVIPTIEGERFYPLNNFSWITTPDAVQGVFYRNSPCLLTNESFELWTDGPGSSSLSANPTGWTVAGSSGKVFRSTTTPLRGGFTASILRSGTTVTLTQSIGLLNQQLAKPSDETSAITQSITARLSGRSANASSLRIGINDGATTTYSSYHSGTSGAIERLSVTKTLSAAANSVDVLISVEVNETVEIDQVLAEEATTMSQFLIDYGSHGQPDLRLPHDVVMVGSTPTIRLVTPQMRGRQIVVVSRAPFASTSADGTETDCPADILEHGTLYHLLKVKKPNQDRERLDQLMGDAGIAYARLSARLADFNVDPPPERVMVETH
jgi:hypothetical protein